MPFPLVMQANDDTSNRLPSVDEMGASVVTTGTQTGLSTESTVFDNEDGDGSDRTAFRQARRYIKTGWPFRVVTSLYSERKLLVMFLIHFVATMVIWGHFALIKYQEQEESVPPDANRYWWKVLAPTLEFGAMHAILFQMALLPLTVSRLSIAVASSSVFDRIIPFNRMMRLHIHLGYTMVTIVIFATLFFFTFFGLLCSDGEEAFCDKFTSEIMITGYCIFGFLLIIGFTSFLRDKIKYEIFYAIHHLVLILYMITIIHTLDVVQRTNERQRSQTFKWFSAFVLYYVCDRAAMHMNHRYQTSIAASSAVTSGKGTRMAIIKVHRPVLFHFMPGQYCLLRIPSIDRHWHPFSIASGPDSDYLEFYIEVYDEKSWTNQLWTMIGLHRNPKTSSQDEFDNSVSYSDKNIKLEVKGPYGTSIGKTSDFSHAISIGSGTGIVPVLSMLKQHVHQLLRLDTTKYFTEQELRDRKIRYVSETRGYFEKPIVSLSCSKKGSRGVKTENKSRQKRMMMGDLKGSDQCSRRDSSLVISIRHLENIVTDKERKMSLKEIRKESRKARLPIFGSVALLFTPVLGAAIIGLTISWNTILIDLYPFMEETLKVTTIIFQCIFALVTFFVHDRTEFLTYIDVVVSIVCVFADWYWFATDRWCDLSTRDLVAFSLLLGYMTIRTWYNAVKARSRSWRNEVGTKGSSTTMDKLTFVWVTRSASLVSKIVPDIIHIWNSLCDAWGEEAAKKVCNISIYITDEDDEACDALKAEIGDSSLFKSGAIEFGRPDMQELIEDHSLDRINDTRGVPTTTLLAFCGSPSLASVIQQAKIANDVSAVVTGNGHHQMEFISESYGASKSEKTANYSVEGEEDGETGSRLHLSRRVNSVYGPMMKGRGTIESPRGDEARLLSYSFEQGLDAYYEVIETSNSYSS